MIEIATQDDYLEIMDVWEMSVRWTHDFLDEKDIQFYKQLIAEQYLDKVDLFCVRKAGKIIGFAGLSADKIEMLFVRPEFRGKHVGSKLVNFAIREKGIRQVDVNEQNHQAVGFYKHIGFDIVKRLPTDSAGNPFPILEMKLKPVPPARHKRRTNNTGQKD
jgi:putative acetyltransferase